MKKENIEFGTFYHELFDENHEKEQMREKSVVVEVRSRTAKKKSSPSIGRERRREHGQTARFCAILSNHLW